MPVGLFQAEMIIGTDGFEALQPIGRGNAHVQESLDHIVAVDLRGMRQHPSPDFVGHLGRFLAGCLDKGKHHQREIALKFFLGFLYLQAGSVGIKLIKIFETDLQLAGENVNNIHSKIVLAHDP